MDRSLTIRPQNVVTIAASLLALVLMIADLTLVPERAAPWATTAGVLLLVATGFYGSWHGKKQGRSDGTR